MKVCKQPFSFFFLKENGCLYHPSGSDTVAFFSSENI